MPSACATTRILARHILPNVSHIVIIAMVMDFSGLVLAEAVLSYVGRGRGSFDQQFRHHDQRCAAEMSREPVVWWASRPHLSFMFALVLAANLFADAARDGFDPRLRV
jgi:peptide/nickel transport system permease protein